MVDIPEEVFFGVTLKTGTVYYFQSEKLIGTDTPHYFVVLSKNPTEMIILVCATTQIVKRKKFIRISNLPSKTLVTITPADCSIFSKDTLFDCNSIVEHSKSSLLEKYGTKKLRMKGEIPSSILSQLIKGVKISPLVPEEIKDLI